MVGFWLSGLDSMADAQPRTAPSAAQADPGGRIRELEHQIERMMLLNQALWELIRARLQVTEQDLEKRVREIDLRDGVQDGRMTTTAMQCPACSRISSSRHWKCLYCGQLFEKPVMG